MRKVIFILAGLFLTGTIGLGQTHRHQATIKPVAKSGFYKIVLPPAITNCLKTDFSDIRIFDKKQKPVPYLHTREEPVRTKKLFREYEVVQKISRGKATSLVLRNPNRTKINNISLVIKNTNVTKKARLSGSPDAQTWYGIENNYLLQALYSDSATTEVKILNFPLSDYEYYKLDIDDSLSAPLNILTAGYYNTAEESGKYTRIPNLTVKQTDSTETRKTYLKITSPTPILIDKLAFTFTDSTYFLRPATVGKFRVRKTRRGRGLILFDPEAEVVLKSNSENSFLLSPYKTNQFYIIIENGDNPPLEIKEVRAYVRNTYLIASLHQNTAYQVQFNNPQAFAPSYDLAYFKNQIPNQLPEITPVTIKPISASAPEGTGKPTTFFTNKNIIWAAVIVVITLLAYMSFKMLNETSKRSE